MAIGAAVSLTPLPGHVLIAVTLAALLGQSKLAAGAGVWINNPLTLPVFYGSCYAVGAKLLGYPLRPAGGFWHAFTHLDSFTSGLMLPLWVGWPFVAAPVAALSYWVTYQAVVAYRLRAQARRAEALHRWHWDPDRGWSRIHRQELPQGGEEKS
jgi:uncharacterized protein (DUF2062 family)